MQPPYIYTYPYFPPLYDSRVAPAPQPAPLTPKHHESDHQQPPPPPTVVESLPAFCQCQSQFEIHAFSEQDLARLSAASDVDPKFKRLFLTDSGGENSDPDECLTTRDDGLWYFNSRLNRTFRSRWLFRKAISITLPEEQATVLATVSVGDHRSKIYPWWSFVDEPTNDSMKLLVVGETDPTFIFQLECDDKMFSQLKSEQNLHVSFQEFTRKIIDLLTIISSSRSRKALPEIDFDEPPSECVDQENILNDNSRFPNTLNNSSFLASMKVKEDVGVLNIVESTPFRSLTHLTLHLKRLNCCSSKRMMAGELLLRICYARFLESQYRMVLPLWDQALADKQNLVHKLQDTRESLEQKLQEFQKLSSEEQRRLTTEWTASHTKLQEEIHSLRSSLESVALERSRLNDQVDFLKVKETQCAELQLLNVDLQSEKMRLEQENAELKVLADREKETSRILEGMADERAEYARLRQEVGGLRQKFEEKSEQLSLMTSKYKEASSKLKESERTVEALQAQFEETRQGLDELRDTFTTRNEELKSKEKDYQRVSDMNSALQQDCARLHQTNVELNKRLTEALVRMAKRDQPEHFCSAELTTLTGSGVEDILFPEAQSASRRGPPKSAAVESGKLDFSFAPRRKASVGSVPVNAFTIRRRKGSLGPQ